MKEFLKSERRYAALKDIAPERSEMLQNEAEEFFKERYLQYKKLAQS